MNIVEIIKAIVGPMIILLVAWLAYAIITGNVTERNSFGLNGVIAIIAAMGAAYSLWAYGYSQFHPPSETKKADGNAPKS